MFVNYEEDNYRLFHIYLALSMWDNADKVSKNIAKHNFSFRKCILQYFKYHCKEPLSDNFEHLFLYFMANFISYLMTKTFLQYLIRFLIRDSSL